MEEREGKMRISKISHNMREGKRDNQFYSAGQSERVKVGEEDRVG